VLDGFSFEPYDHREWYRCGAWIASKTITATNCVKAFSSFLRNILIPVSKCSVISQCAFRLVGNSYFIYRENQNSEKVIFICHVYSTGYTGLHFTDHEIMQLPKFNAIPRKQALFFIMEAANASTFYTRLVMLLAATEALVGEIKKGKKVETNKKALRRILGSTLFDKFYAYGTGLRHKLIHGNLDTKTHRRFNGLAKKMYDRLRDYFKNEFGIQLNERVVHPQRNFYDNFYRADMFWKLKDEKFLNLRLIENALNSNQVTNIMLESSIKPLKNY